MGEVVRLRWWWESNKEEEMEGLTGGGGRDKVGCGRQTMAGDSFWSMYKHAYGPYTTRLKYVP